MIGVNNQDVKLLKEQLTILSEPIPHDVMMEIDYCIQNLVSDDKTANGMNLLFNLNRSKRLT